MRSSFPVPGSRSRAPLPSGSSSAATAANGRRANSSTLALLSASVIAARVSREPRLRAVASRAQCPLRGSEGGRPLASGEIATSDTAVSRSRSEEHTSELQSLAYLVCRLLLEKKNQAEEDQQARQRRQHL